MTPQELAALPLRDQEAAVARVADAVASRVNRTVAPDVWAVARKRFDAMSAEERERVEADGLDQLSRSPDPVKRMLGSVIKAVTNLSAFAKATNKKDVLRNSQIDALAEQLREGAAHARALQDRVKALEHQQK